VVLRVLRGEDLGAESVEIHDTPAPDGYRRVRYFPRGEHVVPAFAPDFALEVDAILEPQQPERPQPEQP
jgi:Uma2 family endonuclease